MPANFASHYVRRRTYQPPVLAYHALREPGFRVPITGDDCMCSTPPPAGLRSDGPAQPPSLTTDIAMEDWDLLFDAVIVRLQSSFDNLPADNTAPRRAAWMQTRVRVMDCVQALDQLHLAASHELARLTPPAEQVPPSATAPQRSAVAADVPPVQDAVVRAIWQVWYDHLAARTGVSTTTRPPTQQSG